MVIKETSVFTRRVEKLLAPESYRLLQLHLIEAPDSGDLIQGTSGLRKLRWEGQGRGKRGGVRLIYYWVVSDDILLFLMIYGKNEQDDLTAQQKTILRRIIQEEYP